MIWCLSIGLTELKLSGYQHTWSSYSWFALLTGIVSFLVGTFVMYVVYFRAELLPVSEIRRKLVRVKGGGLDGRRFFTIVVMLFAAYVVAYAIEIAIEGNVPLFSPRPDLLRVSFGVFGLHLIVNAMMAVVLLAAEYLLVVPARPGRKSIIWIVILFSVVSYFLLLQRYTFFIVSVIVMAMIYYTSNKIRFRHVGLVGFSLVVVFLFINRVRSARFVQNYIYLSSKMKFSKEYWILAEPYMYVSMNLENFARAVDKLDHFYFGYFTFDWLLALTGLKHWLAEYFDIVRLPYLNSGYNTFTFHWWYYYDFGIFGVAVFPFVTGLVIASFYYRLRTEPSLLTLMMYSCGVVLMVASYFMNPLNRLDFVSNILIIVLVHRFVISRPTVLKSRQLGPLRSEGD